MIPAHLLRGMKTLCRHTQRQKYIISQRHQRGGTTIVTDNMHKIGEVRTCGFQVMRAFRQTDRQADMHLPVSHRVTFKLCLITWKTLHTAQSPYLFELFTHYLPPRALHSSNSNVLARPSSITTNFSSRAFSVSAPST